MRAASYAFYISTLIFSFQLYATQIAPLPSFTLGLGKSVQAAGLTLVMQNDGNLVLYKGAEAMWNSGTAGKCANTPKNPPPCYATLQPDGNLVVYNGSTPLWHSHTNGNSGAKLLISPTQPYLQIVSANNSMIWAPPFILKQNELLQVGDLKLAMQADGNLVLYKGTAAFWNSGTAGKCAPTPQNALPCYASMQPDGNLVVYNGTQVLWDAHSSGNPNSTLVLSQTYPYLQISKQDTFLTWYCPVTFAGSFVQFQHQSGRASPADPNAWDNSASAPGNNYMTYGPGTTQIPKGINQAVFSLQVDNNSADNAKILRLEIFDATSQQILVSEDVYRADFNAPNRGQDFSLLFASEPTARLEFRILWYGSANVRHFSTVLSRPSILNVKDFGAVGDGVHDDYPAIQSAASQSAGKVLYFPPGTYQTDVANLVANSTLVSFGGTLLRPRAGAASGIIFNLADNVTIQGFEIDGNHVASGIAGNQVRNVQIKNNHIHNCLLHCVSLDHSKNYKITYNTISDTPANYNVHATVSTISGAGIFLQSPYDGADHGAVRSNSIDRTQHGIQWSGSADKSASETSDTGISDVSIVGNSVSNAEGCIWGGLGDHIVITNNLVQSCSDVGIDLEGTTNSFVAYNTVSNTNNGGLATFYGSSYSTFYANTVYEPKGYGAGIEINGNRPSTFLTITDNDIHTDGSPKVKIHKGMLNNSTVSNN